MNQMNQSVFRFNPISQFNNQRGSMRPGDFLWCVQVYGDVFIHSICDQSNRLLATDDDGRSTVSVH